MGRCLICGKSSPFISDSLGACLDCIRRGEALDLVKIRRAVWRKDMGLPPSLPDRGIRCNLCSNQCRIADRGFCGVIERRGNKLEPVTGSWRVAIGYYYLDPLPTNCVANKVCPASTCRGFPEYTKVCGPEVGYYNLAVFYGACNLDCFFCQNMEHKRMAVRGGPLMTVEELVKEALRPEVTCICYFGGDPAPWSPHSLAVAREVLSKKRVRVCWETNGLENTRIFRKMMEVAVKSGGLVKVDLKAWNPLVYEALTGVRGPERALKNLKEGAKWFKVRSDPPPLVVSTLLVPGYVDCDEVKAIAEYLSSLDERIPYVLLAFYPHFMANDLPSTPKKMALDCLREIKPLLNEVYLENAWLLSDLPYP